MKNLETELKYLVDRSDFVRLFYYLKSQYCYSGNLKQTNYYFDSSDQLLLKNRMNIRIRIVDKYAELTLKTPLSTYTGTDTFTSKSLEFNHPISKEKAYNYIKNGISPKTLEELLGIDTINDNNLPVSHLKCYGSLKTVRHSFVISNETTPILLDISRYLGVSDYEIEWEIDDPIQGESIMNKIFEILNIHTVYPMNPKKKRFFDRLKTQL